MPVQSFHSVFLFLDLETTGHDPVKKSYITPHIGPVLVPWHEIIDIGGLFVDVSTFEILGEWNQKILPKHPNRCIPNIINHYPDRFARGEWKDAPYLEEGLPLFLEYWSGFGPVQMIGHNFFFDWGFLDIALRTCGIGTDEKRAKYFHYHKLDTYSMAVQQLLESGADYDHRNFSLRNGKLQDLLNLSPEPVPHHAINGAHQAYNIFRKLLQLRKASKAQIYL